jgi:hypothetical protein
MHHVSLLDENGVNPARVFGRDLDLLRFEPAIGLRKAGRESIQALLPPVPGTRTAERYDASQDQQPYRHPRLRRRFRRSRLRHTADSGAAVRSAGGCGCWSRPAGDLVSAVDIDGCSSVVA